MNISKQALSLILLACPALAAARVVDMEKVERKPSSNAKKRIHGLEFTLEESRGGERNMQWKPKLGIVGLANLGADFRTPDQKIPQKFRRPSPNQLFPKIAPLMKKNKTKVETEVESGGSPGLFDRLRFGKGGDNGGAVSMTCKDHQASVASPCGQCQKSEETNVRVIYSGVYGFCLDLIECVNIETNECAGATPACFPTDCGGFNNTVTANFTTYYEEDELQCFRVEPGRCKGGNSDFCFNLDQNEKGVRTVDLCGVTVFRGKLVCTNEPITVFDPCGRCQTSNTLEQLIKNGNYSTCVGAIECNDKATGSCAPGAATDYCFGLTNPPCPVSATVTTTNNTDLHTALNGLCWNLATYFSITSSAPTCSNPDYCMSLNDASTFETCVDSRRRQLDKVKEDFTPLETYSANFGSYVGFVRVPKTGSSTLLKFLQKSRRLFQWNLFVSEGNDDVVVSDESHGDEVSSAKKKENEDDDNVPSSPRPRQEGPAGAAGACVFGIARSKSEISTDQQTWWNSCVHVTFGLLITSWTDSLALWNPPKEIDEAERNGEEEETIMYQKTLNVFTMVRDPFNRLVSYFYYLRKFSYTNNFLMNTVTKTQYKFVEDNDLEGWLHQMHIENGGRGLNLPYQYKYVHEDVDEAIKLIRNEANPQVYTLLTECYEVSLRLMAENYVGFRQGEVDKFIESDDYETNNNKAMYNEKPDKETLLAIRAKAEVWFADDFKFFDVAVEQFIEKMEMSGLSKEALETCKYWTADGEQKSVLLPEKEE